MQPFDPILDIVTLALTVSFVIAAFWITPGLLFSLPSATLNLVLISMGVGQIVLLFVYAPPVAASFIGGDLLTIESGLPLVDYAGGGEGTLWSVIFSNREHPAAEAISATPAPAEVTPEATPTETLVQPPVISCRVTVHSAINIGLVRAGAGREHDIMDRTPGGTALTAFQKSGEWFQVYSTRGTGWMHESLVSTGESCALLLELPAVETTPTGSPAMPELTLPVQPTAVPSSMPPTHDAPKNDPTVEPAPSTVPSQTPEATETPDQPESTEATPTRTPEPRPAITATPSRTSQPAITPTPAPPVEPLVVSVSIINPGAEGAVITDASQTAFEAEIRDQSSNRLLGQRELAAVIFWIEAEDGTRMTPNVVENFQRYCAGGGDAECRTMDDFFSSARPGRYVLRVEAQMRDGQRASASRGFVIGGIEVPPLTGETPAPTASPLPEVTAPPEPSAVGTEMPVAAPTEIRPIETTEEPAAAPTPTTPAVTVQAVEEIPSPQIDPQPMETTQEEAESATSEDG
jgi:hypothetical protein